MLLIVSLVLTRGHPGWLVERTLRTLGVSPGEHPGYGVFGTVLRLEGENIIVSGRSGDEVTVVVERETVIERVNPGPPGTPGERIRLDEVQSGQGLIAFGRPDEQGRTHVRLVRIFEATNWPPPPPPDRRFNRP